jgi:ElaB/YqjD/DUF883 family membrane-anchored ribosome-binding protein
MSINSTVEATQQLIEKASESADHSIQASQKAADEALANLAQALQNLRVHATPLLERATLQASALAHRGLDSVRETSHQIRVKADHASENTVNYIKQEPVKSVLMAAATGAALMALVSLLSRGRD